MLARQEKVGAHKVQTWKETDHMSTLMNLSPNKVNELALTWRPGKALNAAEIVTNDRDRSNGTFYVSFAESDERRFRLFGGRSSSDNSQNNEFGKSSQFEITITQENNKSYVRAISNNGNIEESELLL